ncbi:lysophospholipid acyltransferase 2-like isoform X2 [Ruditapes philippinarum]|uniref:lysophospholipid acyltransferase 2-like isoform X2 n=1 Tax=Ruditapes philippinarum TaxID=129788 RepID=UPI00295AD62C|nr:lysophospholipid acyltransferase 2-like isoform X2 [Ruditapes philippinarum]
MAPVSESSDFYYGSRLLSPLVPILGLSIDQINFLVCQLVAMAIGIPFRNMLDPRSTSPRVRHAVELLLGIALVLFCFGSQIIHLFIQASLGYVLLQFIGQKWMPVSVFVVAMGYLAWCHIHRMILDYGGYTLDITGPLMISVQKITVVAFGLNDGKNREEKDLNPNQKSKAIREMPDLLTYYSYIFSFHNVMCGPLVFYKDYCAFIDGSCYTSNSENSNNKDIPSPKEVFLQKLVTVVILGALMMMEPFIAPWSRMKDDDFLYNTTWIYRNFYLLCSMTMHRPMYYFAWKLGELVNNSCGLGFSGYDDKGNSKWDLLDNVKIYQLETCTSLKVNVDSWNVTTAHWLRYSVYERCPASIATWAVFIISAFWHGFYPGYYMAFLTAALFTTAARLVRRNIRPYFLQSTVHTNFYDFITFWFTRFANSYFILSFVLLETKYSIPLYGSLFWWLHLLSFGAIVYYNFLQRIIFPVKKDKASKSS